MSFPLPDHKYIPGVNARHPDDAFDWIRQQAAAEAGNAAWEYGLRLIREGFHWEAHEVLEPVWMAAPPNSAEKTMAQAVIQLANAALKLQMERPKAAFRLAEMAAELATAACQNKKTVLGVEDAAVLRAASALRTGDVSLLSALGAGDGRPG